MNKADLVNKIAIDARITKTAAGAALDSLIHNIAGALTEGQKVTLVGFGTFDVSERKGRTGRNPQTGETIRIAACRVPKFSAGKALKDQVGSVGG